MKKHKKKIEKMKVIFGERRRTDNVNKKYEEIQKKSLYYIIVDNNNNFPWCQNEPVHPLINWRTAPKSVVP